MTGKIISDVATQPFFGMLGCKMSPIMVQTDPRVISSQVYLTLPVILTEVSRSTCCVARTSRYDILS